MPVQWPGTAPGCQCQWGNAAAGAARGRRVRRADLPPSRAASDAESDRHRARHWQFPRGGGGGGYFSFCYVDTAKKEGATSPLVPGPFQNGGLSERIGGRRRGGCSRLRRRRRRRLLLRRRHHHLFARAAARGLGCRLRPALGLRGAGRGPAADRASAAPRAAAAPDRGGHLGAARRRRRGPRARARRSRPRSTRSTRRSTRSRRSRRARSRPAAS